MLLVGWYLALSHGTFACHCWWGSLPCAQEPHTSLHLPTYPESDPWGDASSHHFLQQELKKPEHSPLPCPLSQAQTHGIKRDCFQWICNLVYHFTQVILLGMRKKHLILHTHSGYSQYIGVKHVVSPAKVKGRWHSWGQWGAKVIDHSDWKVEPLL